MAQTTAKSSGSEAESAFSAFFFCLLAYPMTLSPPFYTCDKMVPIPVSEASVASMKGDSKSG